MNTLQIQDAFQPYYAGRKSSGPVSAADARKKPLPKADNTQAAEQIPQQAERPYEG